MDRLRFMLAGNATFTIVSKKTGVRFTYKVKASKDVHFVSLLTSPDEYTFLGTIFEGSKFVYGRRSLIAIDAPSVQAFTWFWQDVETPRVDFFHAGKCGRCGRELTVPESIESGLGPECAKRA